MSSFDTLGLSPALLRALSDQGYSTPTEIQSAAIPLVLEGRDLLAAAQTGTGKTAAFTLPLLERLFPNGRKPDTARANAGRRVRALVLTPTRELAAQVHASVRDYGRHLKVASAQVFGGVGMGAQMDALRRGLDVLVATPGRLIDHLDRRTADLSGVEILVLDEADRMLDMGFLPALKKILSQLPRQNRQTLLFSATFAEPIKQLAREFLKDPAEVQIAARNSVAATVTHCVHPVDGERKRDLLLHLLAQDSRVQTLVFGRTKHGCDKLARHLERAGVRAAAIHGNKSQGQRTRALEDFKRGKVTVLVATDIAARGLDIDQLPVVINHDLPNVPEDYVHRIGRTGRAGAHGRAVSLVAPEESGLLRDVQKLLGREIDQEIVDGFAPSRPLRASIEAPRKPAHRPHGKRPPRHAHAGPKPHNRERRGNGDRRQARGPRPS